MKIVSSGGFIDSLNFSGAGVYLFFDVVLEINFLMSLGIMVNVYNLL